MCVKPDKPGGTPPTGACGGGVGTSSSALRGVGSSSSPRGAVSPARAAPRPWAVDESVRRLASAVVQSRGPPPSSGTRAPARGAAPWTEARGRKRARNQQPTLPAWTVRSGIPTNLAGACFNCTRTCHISTDCTYETVCLRCGEEGHHARECPQLRRAGGDRRVERGVPPAAPTGLPARQRLGPRDAAPVAAVERIPSPPKRGSHVDGGVEEAPQPPVVEERPRYRIPARQRLGLGRSPPRRARSPSPPPHRARSPSPPPVESAGSRRTMQPDAHVGHVEAPAPRRDSARPRSLPPACGDSSVAGRLYRGGAVEEHLRDAPDRLGSTERRAPPSEAGLLRGGESDPRFRQANLTGRSIVGRVFIPRSPEIEAAEERPRTSP
ncbi:hypothetical protein QYE76_017238 [Lolium multiflorum]|uniref:CCHC-type domain-containing protein n=1 Tax=Lolium multiflorum TaxID=4521 RepID=A0AAD8QFR9_LOLMU|nr:hypothetical protein QYE76_017238 [Lolium multiflorum]